VKVGGRERVAQEGEGEEEEGVGADRNGGRRARTKMGKRAAILSWWLRGDGLDEIKGGEELGFMDLNTPRQQPIRQHPPWILGTPRDFYCRGKRDRDVADPVYNDVFSGMRASDLDISTSQLAPDFYRVTARNEEYRKDQKLLLRIVSVNFRCS